MNIAIIGLGRIGMQMAEFFSIRGHNVTTLAKTTRPTEWFHTTKVSELLIHKPEVLFVASGMARPEFGDHLTERQSTIDLLPRTLENDIKKLIYISSGAVYGECFWPKKESDKAKPSTKYGLAKLMTEQRFSHKYSKISCSIRVSNIVDKTNPYGLLGRINRLVSHSHPITLVGEPSHCRDYIGIQDFLSVCEFLTVPETLPPIINVGSGESLSLLEILEMVENLGVDKSLISWSPARENDVSMTRLNVDLLKQLSAIRPAQSVEVIKSFLEQLS